MSWYGFYIDKPLPPINRVKALEYGIFTRCFNERIYHYVKQILEITSDETECSIKLIGSKMVVSNNFGESLNKLRESYMNIKGGIFISKVCTLKLSDRYADYVVVKDKRLTDDDSVLSKIIESQLPSIIKFITLEELCEVDCSSPPQKFVLNPVQFEKVEETKELSSNNVFAESFKQQILKDKCFISMILSLCREKLRRLREIFLSNLKHRKFEKHHDILHTLAKDNIMAVSDIGVFKYNQVKISHENLKIVNITSESEIDQIFDEIILDREKRLEDLFQSRIINNRLIMNEENKIQAMHLKIYKYYETMISNTSFRH